MEAIVASLLEKSVVYGAFVWLLWHILSDFSKALNESNKTMKEISETLISFEQRLTRIEQSKESGRSAE